MKDDYSLVLATNIWTHHQAPIAQELASMLGPERFRLAVFQDVDEERRMMGWDEHRHAPWVVGPAANERERRKLIGLCADADVTIFGSSPNEILQQRAASGRLTLVQAERMLKKPFHYLRMINPRYAGGIMRFKTMVNHPHVHALAIGHYAPQDLRTMGAFGSRVWKWGYFVDVNPLPPGPAEDRPIRIMWAGRMLKWKRVDLLLRAVERMQDEPWFGLCTIVGDGEERDALLSLARRLHLKSDKVKIEHSLPFQEVRRRMRENDLYVLPSNRHEGWGAVAGEAMSEGCVLVANEAAGSARELVTHGETGFLFGDGDQDHLASVIERAATDFQLRMSVRQKAWEQMRGLWSPHVAAERITQLISGLLGLSPMPAFESGPCSPSSETAVHAASASAAAEGRRPRRNNAEGAQTQAAFPAAQTGAMK